MVALIAADPRLLPGGRRRRPPLLALPRGTLRARDQYAALVRAGAVRVNSNRQIILINWARHTLGGFATCTVMPALVAGIHVLLPRSKTWMAGTSPAMTMW